MTKPASEVRFVELLDQHKKILYKVSGSYCRQPADRDDLVQEMVLQLWRSFGRYDPAQRFTTWMYRVALNVAISFYRRDGRKSLQTVPVDESILEIAASEPDAGRDGDVQLLTQFIDRLSEIDRALVLLYLDGHAYGEIGEILGVSESNVGTRLSRIKQRLRRDWPTEPKGT